MTDKIVVLSTCGSVEEAEKLARTMLERRLAACVSVVPKVTSYYHWQGNLETAQEYLLIVKSSRQQFPSLRGALEKAHSYEVPEVIALQVVDGSPDYLSWLAGELGKAGE